MYFGPNEDQEALLSGLEQIALGEGSEWEPSGDWSRQVWSEALDTALDENGYYDAGTEETLGPVASAAMIWRLSRLSVNVEASASAMLRPALPEILPRPLAVMAGRRGTAVRFLPLAKCVLRIGEDGAFAATPGSGDVRELPTLAAYPMGEFTGTPDWRPVDADPAVLLDLWRVAVAAEIGGALRGAFDSVLTHVKDREQFGRPLGSQQAVQHRLATAASQIEAAYWLTLKAAQGNAPADAPLALGYAESISTRIVHDLHQFMGAMGLTLEHPLHRWTYRLRYLRSECGGASENMALVADRLWRSA